ncbi:MAG TPA: beta-ketoacyl reductase, partial [Polyangiaceae bacterium]|nr:beta-ketoacyl reductase [Polyangiaceae bacterium]
AQVWGLLRSLAHEHPELDATNIDVSGHFKGDQVSAELDSLLGELLGPSQETQVVLRDDRRWVARLTALPKSPSPTQVVSREPREGVIREGATYVITGGLGGLGLVLAQWLVDRGASHLVLVGRSDPSSDARHVCDALTAQGAEVRVALADVASEEELGRLFDGLGDMPPVRGVIHAAVVLDDGIMLQQTKERFASVARAKVRGTWNLHRVTRELPLDFFVIFSSAVSVLGSPGQSNYAAASAFTDAFAHSLRQQGRPALSINWGPWAEVGRAAQRGASAGERGVASMTPERALRVFERLLKREVPQVAVLDLDLRQWREFHVAAARLPLLSSLEAEGSGLARKPRDSGALLGQLREAAADRREDMLLAELRRQVAGVLRMQASRIEPKTPFASLGLDSLMGLEIRNRLEASLGIRLPATLVWSYPNVHALSSYLLEKLELKVEPAPPLGPSPDSTAGETSSELEALSDDEARTLLLDELMQTEGMV